VGTDAIKRIGRLADNAGAIAAIVSLAMQVSALELEISSDPQELERTKKMSPGKQQRHDITIVMDPQDMPDADNLQNCLLSLGLNAAGVSLSLPPGRTPLGKVGVEFKPGEGFDRVQFAQYSQLKQDTNDGGSVRLDIEGRPQKKDLPDSVKKLETTYSFFVSAQVEEEDLGSIGRMFFDSLQTFAKRTAAAGVAPVLDALKIMKWNLGEQRFPLIDWRMQGYIAHGAQGDAVFDGVICDIEKTFKVAIGPAEHLGTFTFTPSPKDPLAGGRVNMIGKLMGMFPFEGMGDYTIQGDLATGNGLKIIASTASTTTYGPVPPHQGNEQATITLTPISGNECGGQ
jgi:hypothetical protein